MSEIINRSNDKSGIFWDNYVNRKASIFQPVQVQCVAETYDIEHVE